MNTEQVPKLENHYETITKIDGRNGRVYAIIMKCRTCGKERDEGLLEDVAKYGW